MGLFLFFSFFFFFFFSSSYTGGIMVNFLMEASLCDVYRALIHGAEGEKSIL